MNVLHSIFGLSVTLAYKGTIVLPSGISSVQYKLLSSHASQEHSRLCRVRFSKYRIIMSFLNSDKLAALLPTCITTFKPERIESGAYELSMGSEYFTTNTESAVKSTLKEGEQFVIEPGQFALLITDEIIRIPNKNLGFISVKAGVKFRGLINVSGFHVDPGFHGRLKFSVYNAGSRAITLAQGQRLFPLWLGEFTDELTGDEVYSGVHQNQMVITSEDVSRIEGAVLSPAVLEKRIREVDSKFTKEIDAKFAAVETKFAAADSKVTTLGNDVKNKDANVAKYGGIIIAFLIAVGVRYLISELDNSRWEKVQEKQLALDTQLVKRDSVLNRTLNIKLARVDSVLRELATKNGTSLDVSSKKSKNK